MEGAGEFMATLDGVLKDRNARAYEASLQATKVLVEMGFKRIDPGCIQATPNKKYFQMMIHMFDRATLSSLQNEARLNYKRMRFLVGRGIKEGSRVYTKDSFGENLDKPVPLVYQDKDMFKAYVCAKALNPVLQAEDRTDYWTSKGFRKYMCGVLSKSKHSKSHPRNMRKGGKGWRSSWKARKGKKYRTGGMVLKGAKVPGPLAKK